MTRERSDRAGAGAPAQARRRPRRRRSPRRSMEAGGHMAPHVGRAPEGEDRLCTVTDEPRGRLEGRRAMWTGGRSPSGGPRGWAGAGGTRGRCGGSQPLLEGVAEDASAAEARGRALPRQLFLCLHRAPPGDSSHDLPLLRREVMSHSSPPRLDGHGESAFLTADGTRVPSLTPSKCLSFPDAAYEVSYGSRSRTVVIPSDPRLSNVLASSRAQEAVPARSSRKRFARAAASRRTTEKSLERCSSSTWSR